MSAPNSRTKKATLATACAAVILGVAGSYWFYVRQHEGRTVSAPTCRIQLLSRDERIRRENAECQTLNDMTTQFLSRHERGRRAKALPGQTEQPDLIKDDKKYQRLPSLLSRVPPTTEADNPLLFGRNFAVVRFENTTGRPLTLYAIHPRPAGAPVVPLNALTFKIEARDPDGLVIPAFDFHSMHPTTDLVPPPEPGMPSAEELRREPPPTVMIRPGEVIEVPDSILGDLPLLADPRLHTSAEQLESVKPGAYTVRAAVSYAEAPGGETKQVVSEPVTITVTAEQIKAAESFWKTPRE